jgi:SAM-dependent methyltransferase
MLAISERDIRRHGPGHVLAVCWRQWRAERHLARRGVHFRATDPEQVATAYTAMSRAEFDAINGRQDWANWRTIPRALNGHVPDRPLLALDLGCGTGSSTQVLACCCPPGSRTLGYEVAEPLLTFARRRTYRRRDGQPADVAFVCQGIAEPLRGPNGIPLEAGSADLVNASGILGHHFDRDSVRPVVAELQRVLRPDGVALLDVGPTLPAAELRPLLGAAGFAYVGHYRSWFGDTTGEVVFRKGDKA